MTEYEYRRLLAQLGGMSPWKVIAAAATTAEKVSPIVRSLALPDTWRTVESSLNLVWQSVSELPASVDQATQMLHRLNEAPEWQCETPDTLTFFVSKPLDLNCLALSAVASAASTDVNRIIGFSHILDIADELDVAVAAYPALATHVLEIYEAEKRSQIAIVAKLSSVETPSDELLRFLREEAKAISTLIEKTLPIFCYAFVADLCHRNFN